MELWREELYHHGIEGQRWGIRNGPPYPLKSPATKYYKTANMPLGEYKRAVSAWNEYDELDIPRSEKEHVYEELDRWLSPEEKELAIVRRPIDRYNYTAINKGHNQYKIISRKLIDPPKTDDIVDEVLSEMFGSDWRDYL